MTRPISAQLTGDHPRVSVAMITYNHERFIAQAIEGVLNQEVDFEVELVIGEDCSQDGTRGIVQAYARQYPRVIRALLPGKNLGAQKNFISVLGACSGGFIACLEGDDLWINPRKLATQASFLEANPDCATCFHNAIAFLDEPNRPVPDLDLTKPGNRLICRPGMKARYTQKDFFRGNLIPTCSVMFRRAALGAVPSWLEEVSIGDLPLHILCTQHGPAGYLNEVMSAYRLHSGGGWSSQPALARMPREIQMFEALQQHFEALPPSAAVRQSRRHARRALALTHSKLELARARQWLETNPAQVAPAVWRAWRLYPRQLKWLLRWGCAVWPRVLGGAVSSAYTHRKLRDKF